MEDKSRLKRLQDYGQSIWLDSLRRSLVLTGQLQSMIENDGLRGVTSNPQIFQESIGGSGDYDPLICWMAQRGASAEEICEALMIGDVQIAADVFRPLYEQSDGKHGFVSLEVSPHLAHDTIGTIKEARHLWTTLNRPNVFIKVPATVEGLPAISCLIREGINVNITLLFGLPRYQKVALAYIAGIEGRITDGEPVDHVASVASLFLSRIDVKVDAMLEEIIRRGGSRTEEAARLRGEVAIASAKQAYQLSKDILNGERFKKIASIGARPQQLLWASTGTKNPGYSDVKYVEALIGPDTINTLPPETLAAFRDHGKPAPRLQENLKRAQDTLRCLRDLGIDIARVRQELEDEGVNKFRQPYDRLLATLREKREQGLAEVHPVAPA